MNKNIEAYRFEMIEILKDKYELDGAIQSDIPILDFYFSKSSTELIDIMYEPSLCLILQGEKSVGFGNKRFSYNSNEYLVSSAHLPANMKIEKASFYMPYMSLRIKFSLEDIYEVLKQFDLQTFKEKNTSKTGLFFDSINCDLYESIYRLVSLLQRDKNDRDFLYPLICKEILYNLVKTKGGYFLSQFTKQGTVSNKIVKVISYIKENFNEKLNIKDLANMADMSESSLYQHFKTVTQLSPIQFQKKLRLEESKQILLLKNIEIGELAFQVGYESPSQFSREFSKMFGMSPKRFVLTNQNKI